MNPVGKVPRKYAIAAVLGGTYLSSMKSYMGSGN